MAQRGREGRQMTQLGHSISMGVHSDQLNSPPPIRKLPCFAAKGTATGTLFVSVEGIQQAEWFGACTQEKQE